MKPKSVSYTMRMPVDLRRLIESSAKSGGVSAAQLVVDALWKYLGVPGEKSAAKEQGGGGVVQVSEVASWPEEELTPRMPEAGTYGAVERVAPTVIEGTVVGCIHSVPTRGCPVCGAKFAALAAICQSPGPGVDYRSDVEDTPVAECPYKEYDGQDGETYRCRLEAGHKGKCARGERV